MPGLLVVGAEEVLLVRDGESYAASRPIVEGIELTKQLFSFPTSRAVVIAGVTDPVGPTHFCHIHGLAKVNLVTIAPEDKDADIGDAQWYAIERQRANGPVNLVVTAYPEVFERCLASHQPAVLFGRRGSVGTLDTRPSWADLHGKVVRHQNAQIEEMLRNNERDEY